MSVAVRSEAGAIAWDKLTDAQKQAGQQIHDLLMTMAESDDTVEKVDKHTPDFLPRLDAARHSRVLLIDGARGSGKTALLLSVLRGWRDHLVLRTDGPLQVMSNRNFGGRIVPVGLLDLHPIAPSTHLLLHVVGRFERVVEWLEGDGKTEQDAPVWLLAADGVLPSRKAWQALLRAVAAGWDSGADQRRARLDMEAYTVELEEAERERRDLVTAYTKFIEALVEDFQKRPDLRAKRPLFVLAVDDADMNPSRSVELLDLLRMLWHPRVAFLLTGDTALFEQTLAEHFLAELRKPLRGHALLAEEIVGLAESRQYLRLASETYEKIIPPGQRCRVHEIPPGRRLEFSW